MHWDTGSQWSVSRNVGVLGLLHGFAERQWLDTPRHEALAVVAERRRQWPVQESVAVVDSTWDEGVDEGVQSVSWHWSAKYMKYRPA